MADTLHIKVVTPSGSVLDEDGVSFTAGTDFGEFCLLPEHRPIMASVAPGRMIVERSGGAKAAFALDRGFLEAGVDHVNVITERCIPAGDLDKSALAKEVAELEEKLTSMNAAIPGAEDVIRALEWSRVQLFVAESKFG